MTVAIREFATADDLVAAVVDTVLHSDLSHGVALTGGRVGTRVSLALLDAIKATAHSREAGVEATHFWFSDERYLPHGDSQRNDTALLTHAHESSVVTIESVLGPRDASTIDMAALDYQTRLHAVGMPKVAVVSIGPDGHVASIFPGHALHRATDASVRAITDSPKPPPVRVTWTLPLLHQCETLLLLAAGDDKREIVQRVLAGDASLPATDLIGNSATLFIA